MRIFGVMLLFVSFIWGICLPGGIIVATIIGITAIILILAAPHRQETRVCPFCAETIKADAIICRFCQKELPKIVKTIYQMGDPAKILKQKWF